MMQYLPFLLLFGAACGLSYIREIDRLERDCEPAAGGKRLFAIGFAALLLTLLFTMLSADAGLILLTLTMYLAVLLLGIYLGQKLAWIVYCKRNPGLIEEEE